MFYNVNMQLKKRFFFKMCNKPDDGNCLWTWTSTLIIVGPFPIICQNCAESTIDVNCSWIWTPELFIIGPGPSLSVNHFRAAIIGIMQAFVQ